MKTEPKRYPQVCRCVAGIAQGDVVRIGRGRALWKVLRIVVDQDGSAFVAIRQNPRPGEAERKRGVRRSVPFFRLRRVKA